ncbi:MAG TPA: sigma-70 family RNA polymerase sigma factor [Pirellulales bacterium]|nr:sigma-70 family RNA polymerase sigma factor [Pirellulales bacterium]
MMSQTVARTRANNYVVSRTWSDMTDEELLLAYRRSAVSGQDAAGRPAFAELVRRYERELYSYLRRYLGDPALAEDAFQGTFLQVHLKCDQYEEGRKVRPWLYTIATNQAIDSQRRNKRHRMMSLDRRNHQDDEQIGTLIDLLISDEAGPADRMESEERRDWIREAVSQLPPTLLSAVTLIYYQGMKYREAAEILDVPVGTVKSRLHAALLKLHEAWKHSQPSGET